MKEIVGPTTFGEWERSWRVFSFAMELLGAATRTRLDKYKNMMTTLNRDYPQMWWAIAMADIKMRRTHLERIRRRLTSEHHEFTEAGLKSDFDPTMPWDACFREAARDRDFWNQEVEKKVVQFATHQRSKDDLVDPGFGTLKFAQQPGGAAPSGATERTTTKKRRANEHKGQAPGKRANKAHPQQTYNKGKGKGGKGKDNDRKVDGKYVVDTNGRQICWAWNRERDGCQQVCPQKRAHVCEVCRGADPPAGHRTCEHRA